MAEVVTRAKTALMRAYWGVDSRTWDDRLGDERYRKHLGEVADWLGMIIPEHGDVIDLGCGTGNYSLALARRGHRVTGVDFAPGPLKRAEEKRAAARLDTVCFQQADLKERLPFPNASFDAALALYSTQMFEPTSMFIEVARILRPGGAFLVEGAEPKSRITHQDLDAPLAHKAFFRLKEALIAFDKRVGLIRLQTATQLRAMLEGAGFDIHEDHSNERSISLLGRRRP